MKIGYARVSTPDQNCDLQIQALKAAGCDRIFSDEGISAIALERPEFTNAMNCLNFGDTLIIWKMDRAFRSLTHALNTLEALQDRGIEFKSLTDEIDTTTAMGRFVYQIRNAFSELERALISERTKAGMEAAKARGVQIGRPRKLTPQQACAAHIELENGNKTLTELADRFDVSRLTLSRAIKHYSL